MGALSLAELERGVIRLRAQDPVRARRLALWLGKLQRRFAERSLPLDETTLRIWAQCSAETDLAGQRIAALDGLLIASAQQHGLTIVTRNGRDFARYGRVFNPWAD